MAGLGRHQPGAVQQGVRASRRMRSLEAHHALGASMQG